MLKRRLCLEGGDVTFNAHQGTTIFYSSLNDDLTLGRALLKPTQIYIRQVLPAVEASLIKGMAHITGGGFIENTPQVLPKTLGCYIDMSTWNLPVLIEAW